MNVENEFFYIEIEERKIFFYAQMTAFFFCFRYLISLCLSKTFKIVYTQTFFSYLGKKKDFFGNRKSFIIEKKILHGVFINFLFYITLKKS